MKNILANQIIQLMSERKGFDGWWSTIDEDIQNEIKYEIELIIKSNQDSESLQCEKCGSYNTTAAEITYYCKDCKTVSYR